jgi:hypothetical protein
MSDMNSWETTSGSAFNDDAPPDGFPENMDYSDVNNSAREVMAVLAREYRDRRGTLAATGAADAYTLTLSESYTALFAGMSFKCSIPANNTGAATINVNAIGAGSIVNPDGSALAPNQLIANGIYEFVYTGSNFMLMNGFPKVQFAAKDDFENRTSTTTLTDDSDLVLPMAADRIYGFEGYLAGFQNGGGFRVDVSPSVLAQEFSVMFSASDESDNVAAGISSINVSTFANGDFFGVIFKGAVHSAAGSVSNLRVRTAQSSSNAASTVFYEGSYLRLQER